MGGRQIQTKPTEGKQGAFMNTASKKSTISKKAMTSTYATVVAIVLAPTMALCFPGKNFLEMKIKEVSASQKIQTTKDRGLSTSSAKPKCANIAGKWKGSCTRDNVEKPVEVRITQNGCDRIDMSDGISGESYEIPGLKVEGKNSENKSEGTTGALSWNQDGSVLQVSAVALINSKALSGPIIFTMTGQLMIDGGSLKQFNKLNVNGESFEQNCSLTQMH